MRFVILCSCILLLWAACRPSGKPVDNGVKTIAWPPEKSQAMAEIIKRVDYIPLEVSDSALFGSIIFLAYNKEKIFIVGNESHARIKVFNHKGKFLNHIGQQGRGPGEYSNVLNFGLKGDTVWIGAGISNKVLQYLSDGTFVREDTLPAEVVQAMGNSISIGVCASDERCLLIPGQVILPGRKNESVRYVLTDRRFRVCPVREVTNENAEESVLFVVQRLMCDTICLIDRQGRMIGRYYMDFGENRVTPESQQHLSHNDIVRNKSFLVSTKSVGDYLILNFKDSGQWKICAFNRKTGDIYQNGTGEDLHTRLPNIYAASDDDLSVMSIITSSTVFGLKELPDSLRTSLEEEGGAVLVKYTLK